MHLYCPTLRAGASCSIQSNRRASDTPAFDGVFSEHMTKCQNVYEENSASFCTKVI